MNINWETELYCLIGDPVSKSLSPIIHNELYKILKEKKVYLNFEVKEDKLKDAIKGLKSMNIQGFNVTIPHKISILKYLDGLSKEAKLIGAVNTVKNENGKFIGYNTDGLGFMKSLLDKNIDVENKNVLILGAGGAANGIATTLAMAGVKKLYINNRTISGGEALTKKLKNQFPNIQIEYGSLKLENVFKKEVFMIVNCTPVGMYPFTEAIPIKLEGFSKDLILYDTIYKPYMTQFLKEGKKLGYTTINGLSMLINQGLYSQNIWLNKEEKIFKNYEKIRRILNQYVE